MVDRLNRFGWLLIPFSKVRRLLIRTLLPQSWYRHKVSGTFQVTCLPQVDLFAPFLFNTAAALGVGRVQDKVVAVSGVAVVRPMVTLSCSLNHEQWNGMAGAHFLTSLRDIIESGTFAENEMRSTHKALVQCYFPRNLASP